MSNTIQQPTSVVCRKKTSILKYAVQIIVVILLFAGMCYALPAIEWQRCLGGWNIDEAYSIQQTSDGGYIVAGKSFSNDGDVTGNHGGYDYWIVKLDSAGLIKWQRSYGGSSWDEAYSINQTSDGGYILAGCSRSNDGDVTGHHGSVRTDYWVAKLDSVGSIDWQRSLGGIDWDEAYSIQQTSDGGYIIAGASGSNDGYFDVTGHHGGYDYWIVKLDSVGLIVWQRCLGGRYGDDYAYSIQQTSDGGYIVAGSSSSNDGDVTGNHGHDDYWIVKLDSAGGIKWQRCLGGSNWDFAYSIQQTSDGGYIVAGSSNSYDGDVTGNHGHDDYWIVKLDSAGGIKWQRCLGGSDCDYAYSIQQTSDGGYIVAGYSLSNDGDVAGNHGGYDYWLVKLDSAGGIKWQRCLGGSDCDYAYSIQQTSDGGYIIAGRTGSNDGDVTGNHYPAIGHDDYWIVKLTPIIDTTAPIATLVEPLPGKNSACLHQKIVYTIIDSSGEVDWSSILIDVNGIIYDSTSLSRSGDTIYYMPIAEWVDGDTIEFSLISASDVSGNAVSSLPISGSTVIDSSYPRIWGNTPEDGDTVRDIFPTITAFIIDDYSTVKNIDLIIESDTFNLSSPEVSYIDSTYTYIPSSPLPTDLVKICLSNVSDDVFYCGPNITPDYCWNINVIIDTTAPIATLVEPLPGKNSACLHQKIVYTIIDSAGEVNWSSVLIDINGISYDSTSLSRSGDTIYYMPIVEWSDGDTIEFSLISASDVSGNAVSSLPISGSTVIDSSYPRIWGNTPEDGDTVRDHFPTISAFINDDYSTVKNIDLIIESDTFNLSSPEVSYIDSTYTYIPSSPLPTDLVKICLSNVSDDVFYCGPNITPDYCWNINVIIDTTAPVTRLIEPLANTFTSVKRQPIRIILDDEGGILLSSISLTVDSINYDLASPQLKLEDDTLIFTPSSDFNEGLISVSLSPYFDLAGNSGDPLNYIFHTDFTKPTQLTIYPSPGSIILTDTVTIYIELIDLNHGSGIDTSTLQLEINSLIVPFTFDITADIFVKISYFFDGSTVMGDSARIILSDLQDIVDYGPRNIADNLSYKFTFTSGIQEQILPNQTYLNAYPNPFNPSVTINFPNSSSIEIYDINGRIVHSQENVNSGKIVWQPDETISSGVYLVRATTSDGQQITKRIVYLR